MYYRMLWQNCSLCEYYLGLLGSQTDQTCFDCSIGTTRTQEMFWWKCFQPYYNHSYSSWIKLCETILSVSAVMACHVLHFIVESTLFAHQCKCYLGSSLFRFVHLFSCWCLIFGCRCLEFSMFLWLFKGIGYYPWTCFGPMCTLDPCTMYCLNNVKNGYHHLLLYNWLAYHWLLFCSFI